MYIYYLVGYPVSCKIIGRISVQIGIRHNPTNNGLVRVIFLNKNYDKVLDKTKDKKKTIWSWCKE